VLWNRSRKIKERHVFNQCVRIFSIETTRRYPGIFIDEAITFLSLLHSNELVTICCYKNRIKQQIYLMQAHYLLFHWKRKEIRDNNWEATTTPDGLMTEELEITVIS
jgi:hypothetical protein